MRSAAPRPLPGTGCRQPVCRGCCEPREERRRRRAAAARREKAALRTWLPVPPLGMPSTAPASPVPGLARLVAWGRKGTGGGALTGRGQELP
ncbi:translation initiation factor IF-2-like [Grus japonensis]|uniref:Translation initiation factor IF-2-like n=1 Tax=Grus japonensis TaxID=30415 RepID=A0ABC9XB50_GRUJA